MLIEMDPQVYEAFQASTSVSCKCWRAFPFPVLALLTTNFLLTVIKGISAQMLKAGSKRRRTTKQIASEKEEAKQQEEAIQARLNQANEI